MAKYLLVDTQNCFHRSKHTAQQGADSDTRIGLALHITLSGILKAWHHHKADHVVFCGEGHSWRKIVDPTYKANRKQIISKKTTADKEEMQLFFNMIDTFNDYIKEKTNCTMLQHETCEADDMIARWIQTNPNDSHVIISTDKDFNQLIAPNVDQYDPVQELLHTLNGVFSKDGNLATNKSGDTLPIPDPEFLLFLKCIRGDTSDNIFPAYPGIRLKSTKKKIGIIECYEDRHNKGYNWNSFMNAKWEHHDGTERLVKHEFVKNRALIDLNLQPDYIKDNMDAVIANAKNKEKVPMVGIHFIRFCTLYELTALEGKAPAFASFLNKGL